MTSLNLGLRFLLELCGVAAVAWWGWVASDQLPVRLALALVAPVALVVLWSQVIAPGASNPIPQTARMLLGSAVLLLAAGALAMAGQPALAGVFAALVVVNTVLLLVLGEHTA